MLNSKVKTFDCYGEGWVFGTPRKRNPNFNVDLSKLAWNKGYTLSFQGIGVIDPIFGNVESHSPWYSDASFVEYMLKTNNLVNAWLELDKIKDLAEELGVEANIDNLDLLVTKGIDEDEDYYILSPVTNSFHFGNDYALCGITDEEYFKDIIAKLGYDLDGFIDVVYLG